jgi:hypothetical protein
MRDEETHCARHSQDSQGALQREGSDTHRKDAGRTHTEGREAGHFGHAEEYQDLRTHI